MANLTKARDTRQWGFGPSLEVISRGVAASSKIWQGSLVGLDPATGYVSRMAAGLLPMGRAKTTVDNSAGANGDLSIDIEPGVFKWVNGDTIAQVNVGMPCYASDDQTVNKADGNGARAPAGIIEGVDSDGVWVRTSPFQALELLDRSGPQILAAAGAVDLVHKTTILDVDGTMAFTLADGLYPGQVKRVRVRTAANTPDGTLTPASTDTDYSNITLNAVEEVVNLEWTGSAWAVTLVNGATKNA